MVDIWRDFWIRETGTGQQAAQLHERYKMMMIKKTCSSHKITFDIQLTFIYGSHFYFTAVAVPKNIYSNNRVIST